MRKWIAITAVAAWALGCSGSGSTTAGSSSGSGSGGSGSTTTGSSTGGGSSGSTGTIGGGVTDECTHCNVNDDCQSGFCTYDNGGNQVCSGKACTQMSDCANGDLCLDVRSISNQDLGMWCTAPNSQCPPGDTSHCDVMGTIPCTEDIYALADGGIQLKFAGQSQSGRDGYSTVIVLAAPPAVGTYRGTDASVLSWSAVAGQGSTTYAESNGFGDEGTLTLTVDSVTPSGRTWLVTGAIDETLVETTVGGQTTTVSYDLH